MFKRIFNFFKENSSQLLHSKQTNEVEKQDEETLPLQENMVSEEILNHPYICKICHDYILSPITALCGHTFCDFCLTEYLLVCDQCIECNQKIRGQRLIFNIVLNELILDFMHMKNNQQYQQRKNCFLQWIHSKKITDIFTGMALDVRDNNFVWCKGTVTRLINKYNQPMKFLRIKINTFPGQTMQQDIEPNSKRLAPIGYYTQRLDTPFYSCINFHNSKRKVLAMKNTQTQKEIIILKQYQLVQSNEQ